MTNFLQNISRSISERQLLVYLSGVIIGLIIFLPLLSFVQFDLLLYMSGETFQGAFVFEGIVIRFLSGIGIMLTYASICSFVFKGLSGFLKGKEGRAKWVKLVLSIPALLIVGYAVYVFANAILYQRVLSYFESLTLLYGIVSSLVIIYVVPSIKGVYEPELERSKLEEMQDKMRGVRRSLWRGYQIYIHRDYGKVYSKEFEQYQTRLDGVRILLSGVVLLPLSLTMYFIPPLTIVGLILWIRLFSLDHRPFSIGERLLLVTLVVGVLVVSTFSIIMLETVGFLLYFDMSYSIGMLSSILLLVAIIMRS